MLSHESPAATMLDDAAMTWPFAPSLFGYLLWPVVILVPLFLLLTFLPIAPVLSLH
ncbi:hypothetical protein [Bradyrhizobium sp. URHD0069]|uniref:hypothetical protein n=1 Tax=Bradyrhizobium sp. URHD0069 TaxID=1380355 RepID=UPI000B244026|nr:hypothetical protein [Bradyrhizobium sp. URHD0069]